MNHVSFPMSEFMSNVLLDNKKKFRILQSTVPISQVDLLDNVMVVISALVNLNKSVVRK